MVSPCGPRDRLIVPSRVCPPAVFTVGAAVEVAVEAEEEE